MLHLCMRLPDRGASGESATSAFQRQRRRSQLTRLLFFPPPPTRKIWSFPSIHDILHVRYPMHSIQFGGYFTVQKTYALFDFDGTLRRGDSIVSLCLYAHRRGLCDAKTLAGGIKGAAGYGLGLVSPEKAKTAAMAWIKGRAVSELSALAQDFCLNVLLPDIYSEGMEALKAEKARGAEVLLVTASPSFYLEPLKSLLSVDEIIGTRMAVDESGRYTGDICGDNCKGLQKPLRLAEYLAAKGDRLAYDASSAYGDSASDLPMLELCGRRFAVNPKPSLARGLKALSGVETLCWGGRAERKEG